MRLSSDELKNRLSKLMPNTKLLTDRESLLKYGADWTKVHEPSPCLVAMPREVEDVQKLVYFAKEHSLALVPSGGRTGLSGGAVAARGEIVVSFELMNKVLEFDEMDRSLTVQPGLITEHLQIAAEEKGLFYPVDFASAGSSQIGGNIATNAGGIKVIRYGMTRQWVTGLKVVTGEGELLDLNKGLVKNATGYDLRHLFVGSEGTLGFIVEATIKLAKKPVDLNVMVLACADFGGIMQVLKAFQDEIDLCAFEFFSNVALQKVTAHGVQKPFETEAPFYALLEYEKLSDETEQQVLNVFEACVEDGLVVDGVLSQNEKQAKELWALRERISETISIFTPYKNDISVKISHVSDLIGEVDSVVQKAYPEFEIVWYGHIGDGNMHLNILKPDAWTKEAFFDECKRVSQFVFEIVEKYQGSISAEHGLGLLKKDYLHFSRNAAEINYMKAMKKLFDPCNIMNPGKMLPGEY